MNAAFQIIEWPALQLATAAPQLTSVPTGKGPNLVLLAGVLVLGIGIGYVITRQKAPRLLTENED